MADSEISSGYGLAWNAQRGEEEDHHNVCSRLRTQLHPLATRIIEQCNMGKPVFVEPRSPDAPFSAEHAENYSELGAQYFVIETTGAEGEEKLPDVSGTESDPIELGAVLHDNCVAAAFISLPGLELLFDDDEDISCVEWIRVRVDRPRFVYFWKSASGEEVSRSHDIMILHAWNGEMFVFDPTGYQFGFGGYLFTREEYEAAFGVSSVEPPDLGIEEEEAVTVLKNLRAELKTKTKEQILRGEFWQ